MVAAVVAWIASFLVVNTLCGLGNTVGYHRMLTHRAFNLSRPLWYFFVLLGALHGGSPILWVGLHRLHHMKSDGPDDPHSPRNGGFWHAHSGWLIGQKHWVPSFLFAMSGFGQQAAVFVHDVLRVAGKNPPTWRSICPDLVKEPFLRFLDFPFVMSGLFLLQLAAAWAIGGSWGILWLWLLHFSLTNGSWAVNSVSHWKPFGNAPFDNPDDSRDVWWLAIWTFGEGYHNGHHRYPRSAKHALAGGLDVTWLIVRWFEKRGWATDVFLPKPFRPGADKAVTEKALANQEPSTIAASTPPVVS